MPISDLQSPPHPVWRRVPAAEALGLDRWDADFSVHRRPTHQGWVMLAQLGAGISEGQRPGRDDDNPDAPLYRPSHLDRGVLRPEALHLRVAPARTSRAVGPGDVVIGKFLPPRAALITPGAPRHAPDANCLRVLFADVRQALWVTAVLSHPAFAEALSRQLAGSALPRLGARDLAQLPFPPPPEQLTAQTEAWSAAAEERLDAARDLLALQDEATELADDAGPPPPDACAPTWIRAADIADTLAPDQAALLGYQRALTERRWIALGDLLAFEPARRRDPLLAARLLRLQDADDELGFSTPPLAPVEPPWFRIYADPLRPGEVLLSTLGSAPKVLVNLPPAPETLWVVDAWARLDGGEHPGALALALGVPQVRWQLSAATTGAVRQFVTREELAQVRIPPFRASHAASLHHRAADALTRRATAHARLVALRDELQAAVTLAVEARP